MSCLRVPGEETTQDVTVTSWTTCAQQSFHGSIQTAIKDEVSMSLTSARSDCAVSGVVIRIVLCSPTPHRNQRVELRLCRCWDTTMRNLAGTTLPCNRPQQHRYRVTTSRLWLTFVSEPPLVRCLPIRQEILNVSLIAVTCRGIRPPLIIQTGLQMSLP